MSAQIITALRLRAEMLDGRADGLENPPAGLHQPPDPTVPFLRLLAHELRAIADLAEQPRDFLGEALEGARAMQDVELPGEPG